MSPLSFNATLPCRAPAGCARNAWSILSVVQCSSMAMALITLLWLMLPACSTRSSRRSAEASPDEPRATSTPSSRGDERRYRWSPMRNGRTRRRHNSAAVAIGMANPSSQKATALST